MNRKVSNKIIGIDLGTTNSCVAINGKVIANVEGKSENTTPSVVFFNEKGEKEAVGKVAKGQVVFKPKQVVFEVKRLIGRNFNSKKDLAEIEEFRKVAPFEIVPHANGDAWVKIGNKNYSPQQISAFVLEKMKEVAEDHLGEMVKRAVITVPAYFNDAQRQATKDAGKIAGLEVARIIDEPTAAALAYGIDKNKDKKPRTIAVFDLGGGTFDISIIEISGGVFEVKATDGDTFLGGANFDQKILDWLIKEFESEPGNKGIDLRKDPVTIQRLKEKAENAKHDLSSVKSVKISLDFVAYDASGPKHIIGKELSRQKLEEITADLLKKVVSPCKNCLKEAGITGKVDEVILVGGMTRMPSVREKVKEIFGKEPNKSVNPDEAVAIGASIQGGIIAGDTDTKDILLVSVTPLTLGIETDGGVFARIIPRNTSIPTDKTEVFSTAVDNQTSVHVVVYQGEREEASKNKLLGDFELSGIEKAPRGIPQIEVKFDIDSDGIVKVSAKDRKTGKKSDITITNSSGLSKEEVERMVEEAEKKRAEDEEFKENITTLNRAQTYCNTFEKQIEEFKNHKDFKEDDPQFQEFKKLYDNLKAATKAAEEAKEEEKKEKHSELKKQINKIEELMKLSQELMQKMPKEEKESKESEDTLDVQPEKKDEDKK